MISTKSPGPSLAFHESLPLAFSLFLFWVVLSGKFDLFHLGAGVVSSLAIAYASLHIYGIHPPVGPRGRHPFSAMPWLSMLAYLPWLSWQILIAAFQIARVVLQPKMNIRPQVFRFTHPLPHNLARATLANSITLTPGTVTLDVHDDEYLVHGLTEDASQGLLTDEPGDMKTRVSAVFSARA